MTPEGKVQAKIIRWAKRNGFLVKRNYMAPGAEVGWPDLEIFLPQGLVLFVEVKAPGGKLRKVQEHKINQLRKLGHAVLIVDNYDWFRVFASLSMPPQYVGDS